MKVETATALTVLTVLSHHSKCSWFPKRYTSWISRLCLLIWNCSGAVLLAARRRRHFAVARPWIRRSQRGSRNPRGSAGACGVGSCWCERGDAGRHTRLDRDRGAASRARGSGQCGRVASSAMHQRLARQRCAGYVERAHREENHAAAFFHRPNLSRAPTGWARGFVRRTGFPKMSVGPERP